MKAALACLPRNAVAAHEAHRRLRSKLPVREHRIYDESEMGQGYPQRVKVNGRTYPSCRQAALAHGVSLTAMIKWLANGKAEYA